MLTEFFLAAMKTQRDEGGGRILLGVNTGVGRVMLQTIRLHCVEFGFRLECLIYIYIYIYTYLFDHVCNHYQLEQNYTCTRPTGT
jgi:hypothetical protein